MALPGRCTGDDVMALLNFTPINNDLSPFIDAANELVTELCGGNIKLPWATTPSCTDTTDSDGRGPNTTYSSNRLRTIEVWLSAHFVAIRDPVYTSEHLGPEGVSYSIVPGPNLSLTPYGQQAMLLDTSGNLAFLNAHFSQGRRARPGVTYLGTHKNESFYEYPYRFWALFGEE